MADAEVPSQLQIPTVTLEDLYAFHARVFGSPAPGQLCPVEEEAHDKAAYEEGFQTEEDDLGYYPDGVKRTLTDDQIAMFRHSEIYSILRERQLRQENMEADGREEGEVLLPGPEAAVRATASSNEEGEVLSDGEVKEVCATVPESAPKRGPASHAKKKRKRQDTNHGHEPGSRYVSRSARGIVRELDSVVAQNQILDYDDEPSAAAGSKENCLQGTEVVEQDSESQTYPAEGKKIWWPVIGAT